MEWTGSIMDHGTATAAEYNCVCRSDRAKQTRRRRIGGYRGAGRKPGADLFCRENQAAFLAESGLRRPGGQVVKILDQSLSRLCRFW